MTNVLLVVLGGLGCVAMMGAVMVGMRMAPRMIRRSDRIQRFAERALSRLRAQSAIDRILSWVEDEHPDFARATAPDGTVTLLFSDIEGSSRLTEHLGDQRWLQVLGAHNALVRSETRKFGGYEVKSQGDGFMIAFPSARKAVECAVAIQRAMDDYRRGGGEAQIHVRIGVHTGEAIRQGDDFFGRSVILAARIANEGRGDEILVSSLVKELIEGGEVRFESPRYVELAGLSGTHAVYTVPWQDGAPVVRLQPAAANEATG